MPGSPAGRTAAAGRTPRGPRVFGRCRSPVTREHYASRKGGARGRMAREDGEERSWRGGARQRRRGGALRVRVAVLVRRVAVGRLAAGRAGLARRIGGRIDGRIGGPARVA